MYVITQSYSLIKDIENSLPVGFEPDDSEMAIIELELSDIESGSITPNPENGLKLAGQYAESGNPVVILCARNYPELELWQKVTSLENVYVAHQINQEVIKSATTG